MSYQSDYSALDRPEFLQFVFYPRKDSTPPPPNSTDHLIPVEKNVSISCRFYVCGQDSPSILYFHGNGEVACDYDDIAPIYNQLGINLFVADYRGYGLSGGMPTFAHMVADAHHIFKGFQDISRQGDYRGNVFVMGRSLGSISAIELASHYPGEMKGLIVESGFASVVTLMGHMGLPMKFPGITDLDFPNLSRIRTVTLPTLIIHGENDSLIPPTEARKLYENVAAKDKRLVIIPGADHNSILVFGIQTYFRAISEFLFV